MGIFGERKRLWQVDGLSSVVFRYAITIVLFVFFSHKLKSIDFSRLWEIPVSSLLYFFLMKLCIYLILAYRLRLYLKANLTPAPFFRVFLTNKMGLLISYILPSAVFSDLSKIYFLKDFQKDKTRLLVTLFIDRLIGLVCIMLLLLVASIISGAFSLEQISYYFSESSLFRVSVFSGTILGGGALIAFYLWFGKLRLWLKQHISFLSQFLLIKTFLLTVLGHLLFCYLVFAVNRQINMVDLSFGQVCIIFPTVSLGTTLPTTPGSVGVGQALYKYAVDHLTSTDTDSGVLIFTLLQLLDIPFLLIALFVPTYTLWRDRRRLRDERLSSIKKH